MTTIRLLKNGGEAFPAMFDAIDGAVSSIALEMYIVADDETGREYRSHLVAAAKRGVRVMVIVDAWGSWDLHDSFWEELRMAGGLFRWFRPLSRGLFPFRNHRKLLLVDDRKAFIGGMNIADEYYRGTNGEESWRDNALEISGPEAGQLRGSFMRMWSRANSPFRRLLLGLRREQGLRGSMDYGTVRFLESGPEDPMRPVRAAYLKVVKEAARSIDLAMGYFYPHGRMMRALKRAVKRGVPVRLLFPQKTDVPMARWAARGLYGRLLRAGVEVWEYLPSMMHAKLTIADDTVVAGSANMDIRSGRINYELVAVVRERGLASRARADFEADLARAVLIRLEDWRRRPLIQKIKERFSYCLLARLDILFASTGFEKRTR